jgi:hypothetical protein
VGTQQAERRACGARKRQMIDGHERIEPPREREHFDRIWLDGFLHGLIEFTSETSWMRQESVGACAGQ